MTSTLAIDSQTAVINNMEKSNCQAVKGHAYVQGIYLCHIIHDNGWFFSLNTVPHWKLNINNVLFLFLSSRILCKHVLIWAGQLGSDWDRGHHSKKILPLSCCQVRWIEHVVSFNLVGTYWHRPPPPPPPSSLLKLNRTIPKVKLFFHQNKRLTPDHHITALLFWKTAPDVLLTCMRVFKKWERWFEQDVYGLYNTRTEVDWEV